MPNSRRIGIVDIGSNSIRLVIYEINTLNAYRVIGEFKQSARLSQRIGTDNMLHTEDIQAIVNILNHFKRICDDNQVLEIRAAATAAVRNAANTEEILDKLRKQSGLQVELLSGEDEARLGFLGAIQSLDIEDGILVDIGGGSTEVTVFRNRLLLKSVSFPFGAVNTTRRFSTNGEFTADQLKSIRQMVLDAVEGEPWIKKHPGLPLIGLGGTIRTLSKIDQKKWRYSLPITHNYHMPANHMDELVRWLPSLPVEKRKKVEGLSKDRYDIIVPGMVILHTLFQAAGSSHYVVSGAGLRDGLFYESYLANQTTAKSLLEISIRNLLGLHFSAPPAHLEAVAHHAMTIFDALQSSHGFDDRSRQCLYTAALLYRIGVSVNYYQFVKHSNYIIAHSRLAGLSHREILLVASIASYKTKNKGQQTFMQHKDILQLTDVDRITKLGAILQLAVALDITETQTITSLSAAADQRQLHIHVKIKHDPSAELEAVDAGQKEFHKIWGLKLIVHSL